MDLSEEAENLEDETEEEETEEEEEENVYGEGGKVEPEEYTEVDEEFRSEETDFEEDESEAEYDEDEDEVDADEEPIPPDRCKPDNVLDFESVKRIAEFLLNLNLVWPDDLPKYHEELLKAETNMYEGLYPWSYFRNSSKENAVSWHADNFREQFQHEFPDRLPLHLSSKNECEFIKLLPTYIKPRLLPYPDLFYAESCVDYFKDFFNVEFLKPSTEPEKIRSHLAVFKDRKANCYEHSIIVATVLIGAGYDAYVVDGYATKEVTKLSSLVNFVDTFKEPVDEFPEPLKVLKLKKEVFDISQFDEDEVKILGEEGEWLPPPKKYKARGKKHFISAYQEEMKEREAQSRQEEEEKAKEEEHQRFLANQPQPKVDPLLGFRVHCWIMILPGKRGVEEPFFLEPFTGTKRPITDEAFLGIESVFNNKNYWVNLQNCATKVGDLKYDLGDAESWLKLLLEPNASKAEPVEEGKINLDDEEEEVQIPEMYLDMPVSWTADMYISLKDYKQKYAGGTKTFEYNDAIVERSAPYAQPDGILQKVIKFNGTSRKPEDLLFIDERFDKRQDKLIRRKYVPNGRIIHEYFAKGRPDSLKEHIFFSGKNKPHIPRHLYYYSACHAEGVYHRQVLPHGLIEEFEDRSDHLIYRETFFGEVLCITMPEKVSKTEEFKSLTQGEPMRARRIILGIVEKYSRNPEKDASDDIAEKHMMMSQGKIYLIYHYGDENYTRPTLEFYKPEGSKMKLDTLQFLPEQCHQFHVDPFMPELNNYKKSIILKEIMSQEQKTQEQAIKAEDEVHNTVNARLVENWHNKLDNEVIEEGEDLTKKNAPDSAEFQGEEEQRLESAEDIDFASPYFLWGEPEDKEGEIELKKRIMQDAKDRIMRRAEYITTCYHEESKRLKHILKHGCTEVETQVAEAESYEDCFQRILSRLHVMEQKLIRFQAKAPRDYCNLLIQVLQHPLLNRFAIEEQAEYKEELERLENLKLLEFAYRMRAENRRSCCVLDYVFDYTQEHDEDEEHEHGEENQKMVSIEKSRTAVSPLPVVVHEEEEGAGTEANESPVTV